MTPSENPRKLEELLTYCVDFAKQMLSEHGEFHPFGAKITSTGTLTAVGAWNGEEFPNGQELVEILMTGFRSDFATGSIQAAAVAANVNIPSLFNSPFSDGIRVTLEGGKFSRNIYIAYRVRNRSFLGALAKRRYDVEYAAFSVDVARSLLISEK